MKTYDYIIVGAGTAGALVANRLSQSGKYTVLIIEAGGKDSSFWLKLPVGYFKSIYNEKVARQFITQPNADLDDRPIVAPRGRVFGGTSSINGLMFIRGQQDDFQDWQNSGATGWGYDDVLPYFRKFECYQGQPSQFRGSTGELCVQDLQNDNPLFDEWFSTTQQMGYPYNADFNGATTYGVGRYQVTVRGHWRESSATAFLKPALMRHNVTIMKNTMVAKVMIENKKAQKRAYGVEVIKNNNRQIIHANKEIILCAGAIQSPQILELSGIGHKDHLQKLNIPVIHHAPEVGENLQDHLQMRSIVKVNVKGSLNDVMGNPFKMMKLGLDWVFKKSGPLTAGSGQIGGALCTQYAKNNRPDIQVYVMPLSMNKSGEPLHSFAGFTTAFWQCRPHSRGSVHIADKTPSTDPVIKTNYLDHETDKKVMIEGFKTIRKIHNHPHFKKLWDEEFLPGADCQSDTEILDAIQNNAGTVFHLAGTCRMGSDKTAVVDPQLCVNGINSLRVVDASVMPTITSGNPTATVYMIAEKASAMILQNAENKDKTL